MLSVKSLGNGKKLVKDTDYKKQVLSYKPTKNLSIASILYGANPKLASVTLILPFFIDGEIQSITCKDCYIVPYNTGAWVKVDHIENIHYSNNVVIFDAILQEDVDLQESACFMIQNNTGELTLTWGGVTLKGLLSKLKHFFFREEVLVC